MTEPRHAEDCEYGSMVMHLGGSDFSEICTCGLIVLHEKAAKWQRLEDGAKKLYGAGAEPWMNVKISGDTIFLSPSTGQQDYDDARRWRAVKTAMERTVLLTIGEHHELGFSMSVLGEQGFDTLDLAADALIARQEHE